MMDSHLSSLAGARILFAAEYWGLGGVETSLLNKVDALTKMGARAQIVVSKVSGEGGRTLLKRPGVRLARDPEQVIDILQEGFDLIVAVDDSDFVGLLEHAHVRGPAVFESHCGTPPKLERMLTRFASPRLSALVVPSPFNARLIDAAGQPRRNTFIIPNPVDPDVFYRRSPESVQQRFGPLASGPVLVWVGRLEDEKNPQEFVSIAVALARVHPDVRFVVIGDSWNNDEYPAGIDALIPAELHARFTFLRSASYERMPEFYSLASLTGGCLVSTSRYEAQPMIFLEAMACQCPIVTSSVGGIREFIGDAAARFYDLGDVEGAVSAIKTLIDPAHEQPRRDMVRAALDQVLRDHSPARVVERLGDLVETISPRSARLRTGPLVSGVLIVYNGERFLASAIESVLAQTYDSWELLLVDDGSTDRTSGIARDYASRFPGRIRYLEHPGHENRGKSASRNLGLREAKGEYLALLDHDDLWLPDKLRDQVAILEAQPKAGMVYGRTRYWHSWTGHDEDKGRDGFTVLGLTPDTLVAPPDLVTLFLRDMRSLASTCSVLIRRDLATRVGGWDESFGLMYEDVAFLTRLYLEAPVFVADTCWDRYRQHADSSTSMARREGSWHPTRRNVEHERLLNFVEQCVLDKRVVNAALSAALASALRPYRTPDSRTARQEFEEVCLEAGLWLARGEEPPRLLSGFGDLRDPDLEPQRVAELIFEAVPEATWTSTSRWLDKWPAVAPALEAFLETLEEQTHSRFLARRARAIFERLIAGTWLLRAADGNQATLVHDGDHQDLVRVAIDRADTGVSWDIQLNRPRLDIQLNDQYVLTFRGRSDSPRTAVVGVAMAREPWANLGLYARAGLTTEWTPFELSFAATDDDRGRIHFDLGDSPVSAEFADVALRRRSDGSLVIPDISRRKSSQPRSARRGERKQQAADAALILMYHRVNESSNDPWSLCVHPDHFAEQLEVLRTLAEPVSLAGLVDRRRVGTVARPSVVVTFDDGYLDNLELAKPLLERYETPATIFVVTGYLGGRREFWWDELEAIVLTPGTLPEALDLTVSGQSHTWRLVESAEYPRQRWLRDRSWQATEPPPSARHTLFLDLWRLLQLAPANEQRRALDALATWARLTPGVRKTHRMLTTEELVALSDSALIDIGAHTVTHPVLSALTADAQRDEIEESQRTLVTLLRREVKSFSYPYGAYSEYVIPVVQEAGLRSACTTEESTVAADPDLYRLPRLHVKDWSGREFRDRLRDWLA